MYETIRGARKAPNVCMSGEIGRGKVGGGVADPHNDINLGC